MSNTDKAGIGTYFVAGILFLGIFGALTDNHGDVDTATGNNIPLLRVDAILACDDAAKRKLSFPSTFVKGRTKVIKVNSPSVAIKRGFTAKNGFGLSLSKDYGCIYDGKTKNVLNIVIF